MPDPEKVQEALEAASRAPGGQREAAARAACGDDASLLAEVLRLLPFATTGDGRLDPPATVVRAAGAAAGPDLRAGRVLAHRFEIVRVVGSGGQGWVAEAKDRIEETTIAVKFLRGLSAAALSRVRAETAALRWLQIPGVVRHIADGLDGPDYWAAMELVEGRPFPGAAGPLSWEVLAPSALRLLDAVARIHAAGVVHGDLKPSNVLVCDDGRVVVLDLGLAAAAGDRFDEGRTSSGGTPGYIAPEVSIGGTSTSASDVYSCGALLFEALTGDLPGVSPDLSRLPEFVRTAVAPMLDRDPARRPQTVADAIRRLDPHPPRRPGRWTRAAMRRLFGGIEVYHHLRTDAAAELWVRTGGDPSAVEDELASWLRSGLARIQGGRIHVDRAALERLSRLPMTHPDLALPRPRTPAQRAIDSYMRALQSEDPALVAAAALSSGTQLVGAGRIEAALTIFDEGASAALAASDIARLHDILLESVRAAIPTSSWANCARARWTVDRIGLDDVFSRALSDVAGAGADGCRGQWADALQRVEPIARRGPTRCRGVAGLVYCAAGGIVRGLPTRLRIARQSLAWAGRHGTAREFFDASLALARAHLMAGNSRESLRLARAAVDLAADDWDRMRAVHLVAMSLLLLGDFAAAATAGRAERRMARRARRPGDEAAAHLIEFEAAIRSGGTPRITMAEVEAVDALGQSVFAIGYRMSVGAAAWRTGRSVLAQRITGEPVERRRVPQADLASLIRSALACAIRGSAESEYVRALAERIALRGAPAVVAQTLALLAWAAPTERAWLQERFRRLKLPPTRIERRILRETMSLDEAKAILDGRPPENFPRLVAGSARS